MQEQQWISFQVGTETYVHAVDQIREIIPYRDPVPVPGAPEAAEGILNVRGNVITILSGRSLLNRLSPGGRDSAKQQGSRIVIVEMDSDQVGVSVDAVGNILQFGPTEVDWSSADGSRQQLVRGTLQREEQLYILTDFSNISSFRH